MILASALAVQFSPTAQATVYYWDVNGSGTSGFGSVTGAWDGVNAFWNSDPLGGAAGATTATVGSGDDLNISGGTTGTITVSGARAASSITFSDNVANTITGGTSLTLGGTGNSNGLFVTSAVTVATTVGSPLILNSTNSAFNISNAGTGLFTVGAITGSASTNQTITIGESGTGGITLNGVIADGSGGGKVVLTVNSSSTTATTTLSGANTFSGGITVASGILSGTTSASAFGTGTITLGDVSGTAATTLNGGFAGTFANAIVVQAGSTGLSTISSSAAAIFSGPVTLNKAVTIGSNGANALTLNGPIGGSGAITLNATGTGVITLGPGGINSTGTITNSGTGTSTTVISGAITAASSVVQNSVTSGLTLSGVNTYSGATNAIAGTLTLNGTGSIANSSALNFNGLGSAFNYAASAAGSSTTMKAVNFQSGDGTFTSTYGTSGTTSVTISTAAPSRSTGATGNFVVSGGTNGTTNSIIVSATTGLLNQGLFFGGSNYAYVDPTTKFVRGINYGVDANSAASGITTTGLSGAGLQEITGAVSGQGTATFTVLHDNGANTLTLLPGASVTTSGILKSGGNAALLYGGTGFIAGAADFVVRSDVAADAVTLGSPLTLAAGSTVSITKTGAGSLTLSDVNGGAASTSQALTIFNNAAGAITITGAIGNGTSSAESVTTNSAGSGALTLSGSNTYTGLTSVIKGTVNVTGNESAATGGWQIFDPSGSNTTTSTVNFTVGSTIAVASGNSFTLGAPTATGGAQTVNVTGTVNDAGSLTLSRAAVLNINNGGVWNQSGAAAVAAPAGSGVGSVLNVNTGGAFNYTGASSFALNPSTTSGTANLNVAGGIFTTGQSFAYGTPGSSGLGVITLTNGGAIALSQNITSLTSGSTSAAQFVVGTGGGVINTNGFSTTLTNGVSGAGALSLAGGGTVTLSGANTASGAITVNSGTTLNLIGTVTGAVALAGGVLAYNPASAGTLSLPGGLTLNPGGISTISVTSPNAINLGAITRTVGSTINFSSQPVTTTTGNANGILGPYATFGSGTAMQYATATGASPSPIGGYSGGTPVTDPTGLTDATGGANYVLQGGGAAPAAVSVNTIQYAGPAATLAVGATSFTVAGLMNVGTGALTISGNTVTIGTIGGNKDLVVTGPGNISISSIIANNGATASNFTMSGSGTVTLTGANTYTGTTYVNSGTLFLTPSTNQTGVPVIAPGATLYYGVTVPSSVYSYGVVVNGSGVASTSLNLLGGKNYDFQSSLTLQTAPTTVAGYSGTATLTGFDTNNNHLVVTAAASGSVLASTVAISASGYGYVANVAAGTNTATGDLTINGVISGGSTQATTVGNIQAAFQKTGNGSIAITAVDTSGFGIYIKNGTIILSGAGRLPAAQGVILGDGTTPGLLALQGISQSVSNIYAGTTTTGAVVGFSPTLSTLTENFTSTTTNAPFTGRLGGNGANNNNLAYVKTGVGTVVLSGNANTYTGGTTITGGLLQVANTTGSATGTGSVALTTSGALGGTGYISGAVTLTSGTSINTRDTTLGTLHLGSTLSFTGTTTLNLDLGPSGPDQIFASGAITVPSGMATINFLQLGGVPAVGTYAILTGGVGSSTTGYTLGTTSLGGKSLSLSSSTDASGQVFENLVVSLPQGSATAFWSGATDANWTSVGNWNTDATSNILTNAIPTTATNVTFYTTNPVAKNLTTTLGANFEINSLSFSSAATTPVTVAATGGFALTVDSTSPITDLAEGVTHTISAPVTLNTGSQVSTWTVGPASGTSTASLTVSGVIGDAGSGAGFNKAGTGLLTLSGANTFFGNTTVSAGTLKIANAAALGPANIAAGKVTVSAGATLDLNGTFLYQGLTIAGSGVSGTGALVNTGASLSVGTQQTPNITLTANAAIGGTGNFGMITASNAANALTLGNFTLQKLGTNTFFLDNTTISAGTVQISGGVISQQSTASNGSAAAFVLDNTAGVSLTLNSLAFSVGSLAGGGGNGGNVVLGSAALSIAGTSGTTSYSGLISGTGSVLKTAGSTQSIISGGATANSYSGGTTLGVGGTSAVVGGTLRVGGVTPLGTGTINFADNATLGTVAGSAVTLSNNITINLVTGTTQSVATIDATNSALTLNGNITGTGSLVVTGTTANPLTLTGTGNAYAAGTTVSSGLLRANNASGSATGTGAVSVSTGAQIGGTGTISGAVTLVGASGVNLLDGVIGTLHLGSTLTLPNTSKLFFELGTSTTDQIVATGIVTSAATVTISLAPLSGQVLAPGTYPLIIGATGSSTTGYALAQTYVYGGNTYSLSPNGTVGENLVVTANATGPGAAFWNGSTTLWTTASAFSTDATGTTPSPSVPGSTTNVTFSTTTPGANLTATLGANFDINSLTFTTTTGAVTVAGTNTLTIESASPITDTAEGKTHVILAPVNLATSSSTATITVGPASGSSTAALTMSGIISDEGSAVNLIKAGTGTLTLSALNTFTGVVNINSGTVKVGTGSGANGGAGAFGISNYSPGKIVVASGATLDYNGNGNENYGITIAGTGVTGTGALINSSATATGSGVITLPFITLAANATIGGVGNIYEINAGHTPDTLNLAGFTLTKLGANTFFLDNTTVTSGTIQVSGGTLSQFTAGSSAAAAAIILDNTSGVSLNLANVALPVGSLSGGGAAGGNVVLGTATLTVGALGATTNYGGVISGTGGLTVTGGSLTLTAANTYTAATTINGGTLALGVGGSIVPASAVTLANTAGATLDITAGSKSIGSLTGGGTTGGTVALGSSTLTVGSANVATTFAGVITSSGSPAVSLVKTGTTTLTLTAVNTYTGGTSVTAGTLAFGTGGTPGASTAPLDVSNPNTGAGTAVVVNLATASSTTTGSLTGVIANPSSGSNTATINNGGQTFTVNQTTDGTFPGTITGGGGFTLGGLSTNTLALTGNNTYAGPTTVLGGTLSVVSNANLGPAGITLSGGALLAADNISSFNHTLAVTSNAANALSVGNAKVMLINVAVTATSGAVGDNTTVLTLGTNGGGLLLLNGTNSGFASTLTVAGGTLGGTTTVGSAVKLTTGTITAGNSSSLDSASATQAGGVGSLGIGSLTVSGGSYVWKVAGRGSAGVSGTGYDTVAVAATGNIDLSNLSTTDTTHQLALMVGNQAALDNNAAFGATYYFQLASIASGSTGTVVLPSSVTSDDASGLFVLPSNFQVFAENAPGTFTLVDGSLSQPGLIVAYTAVPEPMTLGLVGVAAMGLTMRPRRRRRTADPVRHIATK